MVFLLSKMNLLMRKKEYPLMKKSNSNLFQPQNKPFLPIIITVTGIVSFFCIE